MLLPKTTVRLANVTVLLLPTAIELSELASTVLELPMLMALLPNDVEELPNEIVLAALDETVFAPMAMLFELPAYAF